MHHVVVRHSSRDILVVSFLGAIAAGSEGNADAAIGRDYIKATLTEKHAALVVDLSDLEYVTGNYVGGWFLPASKQFGIPVRLVAAGTTAKRLLELLGVSGLRFLVGEPPLHTSVAGALGSLSASLPD